MAAQPTQQQHRVAPGACPQEVDMILAGLVALGHGQLLAHTTSISRRKTGKKSSQARQGFKPSPTHKTTKAPPLGYDSNSQPYTLIRTTKHINKWNLCHRNQQDEIDTNRVAFLHFLIRIYKVNATCAGHCGCRQALWMQNGANRWGVAPVHNNIA